jgi:hypothetical protein
MATVKLTDNVVRSLTSAAHNQFRDAIDRCGKTLQEELAKLEPHLIPKQYQEAFNSLPASYFPDSARLTLRFGDLKANYQYQRKVPAVYNLYNATVDVKTLDVSPELYNACVTAIEKHRAMQKEAEAFQYLVQENLREFTTLNTAVKEWPALEKLVPKEYLDRMRTKVERSAKSKMDEEAKQALNTAMLKSQIL